MTPRSGAALAGWLLAIFLAGTPVSAAPPAWNALTPAQQQILQPLQRDWGAIDPSHREKWLEVAARYPSMSPADRSRLQQRMSEWARMSPAERAGARLRFQETRQLPAAERQARWEAYQSLSNEEREALALRARPPAKGAADADARAAAPPRGGSKSNLMVPAPQPRARPVAPSIVNAHPGATTTTVTTPATPPAHYQAGLPKIAATPGFVDRATLLPQRGPQGAAVRSQPPASAPAAR